MSTLQSLAARRRTLRPWQLLAVAVALVALSFAMWSMSARAGELGNPTITLTTTTMAGEATDVSVSFQAGGGGNSVRVTFPTGFDVSGATGPGVTPDGQVVTVDHLFDPGDPVSFTIGNIVNPTEAGPTGTFTIETFDPSDPIDSSDVDGVTITHAAAAKYVILDPTDGTVDAPINVTVELQDTYGNLVDTGVEAAVDVTLNASDSATVANAGLVDIVDGIGTIDVSNEDVETVTLSLFDSEGTDLDATSMQDVVFGFGVPVGIDIVQDASNSTAGVAISAMTVRLVDQYENTVSSNDYGDISVAIEDSAVDHPSGEASLNGTTPRITSLGTATFADLSINEAGTYTLLFTYVPGDLTANTAESAEFTIQHAGADHLVTTAPGSQTAGAEFTLPALTAVDQYGNVADDGHGATPYSGEKTLTYTLSGASDGPEDGTDSFTTTVEFTNGVSTTDLLTTLYRAQDTTITANADDLGGTDVASAEFTVDPDDVAELEITTEPDGFVAGSVATTAAVLQTVDQYGNPSIEGLGGTENVTVSIQAGDGSFHGSSTLTQNIASGTATFADLRIDTAQTDVQLQFSHDDLDDVSSATFDVVHAPDAASMAFVGGDTIGGEVYAAGEELPSITVELLDAYGNRVTTGPHSTVNITPNLGTLGFADSSVVQASAGVATFTGRSVTLANSGYSISFESGITGLLPTATFNVHAGPLDHFRVQNDADGSDNVTVVAGAPLTLRITARDEFFNEIDGSHDGIAFDAGPIVFSGLGESPDGTAPTVAGSEDAFTTGVTLDFESGVATPTLVAYDAVVGAQLKAVYDGSSTTVTWLTLDVEAGPADALVITEQPSTAATGAVITPSPEVEIHDGYGNLRVDDNASEITVTFLNDASENDNAVIGGSTGTAAGGIVTFDGLTIDQPGIGYALTFTMGGLDPVDSDPFDIGATVALSGSITTATEADIRAGGRMIFLELTSDVWVDDFTDTVKQAIIDRLESDGDGWNAVIAALVPGDVVPETPNFLVITLPAVPGYDIGVPETITATVPASALAGSTQDLVAPETFTIDPVAAFFTIDGPATATAGEDVELTITAYWSEGEEATNYAGVHDLVFDGDLGNAPDGTPPTVGGVSFLASPCP